MKLFHGKGKKIHEKSEESKFDKQGNMKKGKACLNSMQVELGNCESLVCKKS